MAKIRVCRSEDRLEAQIAEKTKISDVIGELKRNYDDNSSSPSEKNLIAVYMFMDRSDGFKRVACKPVFKKNSLVVQTPPKSDGYEVVIRDVKSSSIVMRLRSDPSAPTITSGGDLKVDYSQVDQLIGMLTAIDKLCS